EVLGRKMGLCGGRAGEMHFRDPLRGFMFSFQIVGTCIPVAAGLAWACKNRGSHEVVAVFHGDACTANGQWHEGLNIATVQGLPLLLVCANNGLAGNVRSKAYQPTQWVRNRVNGYGIESMTINGNRVLEVEAAARNALDYIHTTGRPYFLECITTRLSWHKQGQRDMRPKEEVDELTKRDPLPQIEVYVDFGGDTKAELLQEVQAEVREAVDAALAAPEPEAL
ncbi:MAG: thiamine pyrophosphate-dependent enzyme, partial [Dehalococcoidia bacterium]|nr:thiamine pyrophosphate-dependent enzyme [Dehalococcoidia bacterium]